MNHVALTSEDLRAALQLAGESCELPRGSRERKEHAIRGLAKLAGVQVGVFGEVTMGPRVRLLPEFDFGWAGEAERKIFLDYAAREDSLPDPTMHMLAGRPPKPLFTVAREHLIGDGAWYRSPHVRELRRGARVDSFLYSGWFHQGRAHVFALHRGWGERAFSEREQAIVDAFHAGSHWLHDAAPEQAAQDRLAALPLRLQQVFKLLASGLSEKQVAAELGLSQHTVHDYVRSLHKRLGVASRGELLARCVPSRG